MILTIIHVLHSFQSSQYHLNLLGPIVPKVMQCNVYTALCGNSGRPKRFKAHLLYLM